LELRATEPARLADLFPHDCDRYDRFYRSYRSNPDAQHGALYLPVRVRELYRDHRGSTGEPGPDLR
jgi:hypothetical protein